MRFLMFVCSDASAEKYDPAEDNVGEWVKEMDTRGVRVTGDRLSGVEKSILVRKRNGKLSVTSGPFAESAEWIGGFDLLECANLDEAVAVAAAHPMARFGRLEIRPIWQME